MLTKLGRCWRIVATGFCFAVFGLGGLLVPLIVLPIQYLIYRDEEKRRKAARYTVHLLFKFFVGLMGALGIFKFTIADRTKFANLTGKLVLANHPTLIDVVVLISLIPNVDCVVKAHLFSNPFMRGVIKSTGYISNESPEGLLTDCAASLAAGNNLIVFPEGTRTTPGQALKFKRGAANIALRCRADIVSVLIHVAPSTLTKSEMWYEVAPTQAKFDLAMTKQQLQLPSFEASKLTQHARSFTRDMQAFFQGELDSYE